MLPFAVIFAGAYLLLRLVAWLAPDDPHPEHPRARRHE
jgi:hypothetical protein